MNQAIRSVKTAVSTDGRMRDQSQTGERAGWAFRDETENEYCGAAAEQEDDCVIASIYPGMSTSLHSSPFNEALTIHNHAIIR